MALINETLIKQLIITKWPIDITKHAKIILDPKHFSRATIANLKSKNSNLKIIVTIDTTSEQTTTPQQNSLPQYPAPQFPPLLFFKKLSEKARVPQQATFSDAGYDLCSAEMWPLEPGERKLFKTNLAVAIPHGFYGRVAPRSWLAYKHGLDVLAGVIDSGYRGDIGVILINLGTEKLFINEGDKIAQLIIEKCHFGEWRETSILPESQRGDNWYWSSWM